MNNVDPTGNCYFDSQKKFWLHDNWENSGNYIKINNPLKIVGPKGFRQMDIDTDGANPSEISDPDLREKVQRIINNDPYYQKKTSFQIKEDGTRKSINAATINYIVVPIRQKKLLGCVATIYDKVKKKRIYAIVGDCGPDKYNEVSLAAAWNLGYSDATGNNGPSGRFSIIIWKNSKIKWKYKGLQKQINKYGKKYRKMYARYK